ncbi:MAG: hypothetical protein LBH85_02635 [Treponema sp.]|jgi:hypothetical protein|nr:hypothetical protein [Treponema sp.]
MEKQKAPLGGSKTSRFERAAKTIPDLQEVFDCHDRRLLCWHLPLAFPWAAITLLGLRVFWLTIQLHSRFSL